MKIFKFKSGIGLFWLAVALFSLEMQAAPETLLNAVHANQVRRKQRRLLNKMKKLHGSILSTKGNRLTTAHTDKKNEYLKRIRSEALAAQDAARTPSVQK